MAHCTEDKGAFCRAVALDTLAAAKAVEEEALGVALACKAHTLPPQLQTKRKSVCEIRDTLCIIYMHLIVI